MSAVLGISFGNTSSSIAIASQDGKVDVIANPDGDRSIPSAISFVGEDSYFGTQAVAQLIRNPSNTIINFRDYIGKKFTDVDTSVSSKGAKAVETSDGKVGFEISKGNGSTEVVSVFDVSKQHLQHLRLAAEDFSGKEIEGAVITVPTNFSEAQKTELIEIANAAGIKVLQLINEPSSALLAHLSLQEDRLYEDKIFVVADFGGIRSDIAVVAVRGGILTVLATAHNSNLGGDLLDDVLAEYFAKEFEKKTKVNPRNNARSIAKLKSESIVVKKTLSNVQTSPCSIESLAEGIDFYTTVNRLRYELTARDVFTKFTRFIEEAVRKANLETLDIDAVLLVGGTSHSPKLASNLSAIFPESTTIIAPSLDPKALNPAESVADGAALQASLIQSFDEDEIKESLSPVVINTQHLSKPIGFKDAEGKFVTLLPAETAYPIKKSVEVTNGDANAVAVSLFEGKREVKETVVQPEPLSGEEDEDLSEEEPDIEREVVYVPGNELAELRLKDLKPNSKLEVVVNITHEGVLHISGRELKQGSVAAKGEVTFA